MLREHETNDEVLYRSHIAYLILERATESLQPADCSGVKERKSCLASRITAAIRPAHLDHAQTHPLLRVNLIIVRVYKQCAVRSTHSVRCIMAPVSTVTVTSLLLLKLLVVLTCSHTAEGKNCISYSHIFGGKY